MNVMHNKLQDAFGSSFEYFFLVRTVTGCVEVACHIHLENESKKFPATIIT
jgi:hypothetical protein